MKPFKRNTHQFMLHNFVCDVAMRSLSGSGFKILMCAIRQTLGWVDRDSPTGRKEADRISYSQFKTKTGIKSSTTIARAVKECLEAQYLIRQQVGWHPGTGRPVFDYSLNAEYETDEDTEPTTENGVESPDEYPASSESGLDASPENGVASPENGLDASPENGLTKERKTGVIKKEERNQGSLPADAEIKETLRASMMDATYNDRIQPLEFIRENGGARLVIRGPTVAIEWASGSPGLARQIARAAGDVDELVFIEVPDGAMLRPGLHEEIRRGAAG